jgi:uncharacterized membrane protein (UPF0127 family)
LFCAKTVFSAYYTILVLFMAKNTDFIVDIAYISERRRIRKYLSKTKIIIYTNTVI